MREIDYTPTHTQVINIKKALAGVRERENN